MSGQVDQVDSDVGAGGTNRQVHHQPMEDAAGQLGMDPQLMLMRATMREKILKFIRSKRCPEEWHHRLPIVTKYLENILYTKFPNKNDYYNMMNGPIQPQLLFAIKTLIAQNQQNQRNPQVEMQATTSSSSNVMSQKVKNSFLVGEGQIHKKLRCHFCKKIGHFKKDCMKRKKWFENKGIPYGPN